MTTFGPFTFDAIAGALTREGKPVAIGTRGAALLAALIEGDGAPVGKAALMEAAWPGTIVEEANLSVQVANLRKAMGPRPDGQDWIATVPRVGYRLLKAGAPVAIDAPEPVIPSLAVLPFQNLSGEPEQEYFADGVVEDIITALSRFKSFAVIARNSSFTYKGRAVDVREVAKDLGVRYVLEGSVRRAGNRLRISAQLVDAPTGAHLWAQNYDGSFDEVFEFQDRITASVVGLVWPQIEDAEMKRSRRERPNSAAAYDLYLRALQLYATEREEDNAAAAALIERAIEVEPDNASYLSRAAMIVQQRSTSGWRPLTPRDQERVKDWVERALAHIGGDAAALIFCSAVLVHEVKDYERGMAAARQAVATNPNHMWVMTVAGIVFLHCGTIEESLACSDHALRLCPIDVANYWSLTAIAHAQMVLGNYEEAIAWANRSVTVNTNFGPTHWMLAAANAHLGRMDEARRHVANLLRHQPLATVEQVFTSQPRLHPERMAAILEGLRLAGLPEQ